MQMFIGTKSTECSICLDDFRDPRYLPCGHTFCTPCIHELVNKLDPLYAFNPFIRLPVFRCPLCRNIVEVTAQGAEAFPRDVKMDEQLANRTADSLVYMQFTRRRDELLAEIRAEQVARERFEQLAEFRANQFVESRVMELAERRAKEMAERRANELAKRIAIQENSGRRIVLFLLIVVAGLLLHGYYQGAEKLSPCLDTIERLKRKGDDLLVRHEEDLLLIMQMEQDIFKEKTDSMKIRQLKADIASLDELKPTYDLALIKTHELEPAESRTTAVMTLIDGRLLIANAINGELKLRDAYSVTKETNWTTIPSTTVAGMEVCPKNGQVFVSTWNKYIYRFSRDGKMLDHWPIEALASGMISVTDDCNVVLAVRDYSGKILIYSNYGEMISEIRMKSDISESRLIKAVPISKGNFIVSYGEGDDPVHGIDIINANGQTIKSYGGRKGSGKHQLNFPRDFAVDRFGNVLVADIGNRRILLLDSKLKFQRELLSTKNGLEHPFGILLSECENRLYVADNELEATSEKWRNGRIMEFKTK